MVKVTRPSENTTFRRTRVVLENGDGVHPLLALKSSPDGGLMIDLSRYAPVRCFRYGVLDVPGGIGSWQAPIREDEASWATDRIAPKLHYHRSGFLSLDASGRLDRQGIQATPPADIGPNHKHCFSFIARHPFAWQKVAPKTSDLVFKPAQMPTTITIAGHIGAFSNLRQETQPENPWAIMVEQDDGSIVPTIVARLDIDEPRYYVWLELYLDREFGNGDEPALTLYGFDPYAGIEIEKPTEMVGVWSVPAEEAGDAVAA